MRRSGATTGGGVTGAAGWCPRPTVRRIHDTSRFYILLTYPSAEEERSRSGNVGWFDVILTRRTDLHGECRTACAVPLRNSHDNPAVTAVARVRRGQCLRKKAPTRHSALHCGFPIVRAHADARIAHCAGSRRRATLAVYLRGTWGVPLRTSVSLMGYLTGVQQRRYQLSMLRYQARRYYVLYASTNN